MISTYDAMLRLFLAILLGGLIGYERQRHYKSAGLRTHILVALGSCLSMLISINLAMEALYTYGFNGADPGRIAAQVITGISFLGAGTIMANRKEQMITGLTTAASIWVVAALGLVVGAGYLFIAIASTIMIYIVLDLAMHLDSWLKKRATVPLRFQVLMDDSREQYLAMSECLRKNRIIIDDFRSRPYGRLEHRVLVTISARANKTMTYSALLNMLLGVGHVFEVRPLPAPLHKAKPAPVKKTGPARAELV